jgi:hypothetical protein
VIQRSSQGWQVADGLLGAEDADMRFFGALTFTVKINLDLFGSPSAREKNVRESNDSGRHEFSEKDIQDLVSLLMNRFVFLVNSGEKPLVIRKLSSSLVALFLNPSTSWNRAICDLAASLSSHTQVPKDQYLPSDFEGAALPALNEPQIVALLQFSTVMAEESAKRSSLSQR